MSQGMPGRVHSRHHGRQPQPAGTRPCRTGQGRSVRSSAPPTPLTARKGGRQGLFTSVSTCTASAPRWRWSTSPGRCSPTATCGLPPGTPAAFEAAYGTSWLVELLEDYGFAPHLVHPSRCKAIASARLKNDKVDAAILAQLLRADLLPEAWIA